MQKVAACVKMLPLLWEAIALQDQEEISAIAQKISRAEHEADLIKNDIRNQLPKGLFLAASRSDLLEILSLQDSIADKAEDVAVISTIRKLEGFGDMRADMENFFKQNLQAFMLIKKVVMEFDELIETSFGGNEARKVKDFIDQLAQKEHEIDKLQYLLLKKLYNRDDLPYPLFLLWQTIIKEIAAISNLSEKLGNRIRMLLEFK